MPSASHSTICGISKAKAGVSGWEGVSELARFLINNEAAQSDIWYMVRILPCLHVDTVLVILSSLAIVSYCSEPHPIQKTPPLPYSK